MRLLLFIDSSNIEAGSDLAFFDGIADIFKAFSLSMQE